MIENYLFGSDIQVYSDIKIYCISLNNSQERLLIFSLQKGVIIQGQAIISNTSTKEGQFNEGRILFNKIL